MNQLSLLEIRAIAAQAQPLPALDIASSYIEQISCPICRSVKPNGMVIHRVCMKVFCGECVVNMFLLNSRSDYNCGFCRGPMADPFSDKTTYMSLPPNETYLIDSLVFRCPDCSQEMNRTQAMTHLNQCEQNQRFVPPAHLHAWQDIPIVRNFTVSNPMDERAASYERDRLLVYHYNGSQLASKFIRMEWPIHRVKTQIARLADIDANTIRLYSFYHEELDNDDVVSDVAPQHGSFHITAINDSPQLGNRTAMIIYQQAGPFPIVDPPRPSRRSRTRGRAQV